MQDHDEQQAEQGQAHLDTLIEEENHYARLARVFGTDDGVRIFAWLLDHTGYWHNLSHDERSIGKFEFGRYLFNQLCIANIDVCHNILTSRREQAEKVRVLEKKKITDKLKR